MREVLNPQQAIGVYTATAATIGSVCSLAADRPWAANNIVRGEAETTVGPIALETVVAEVAVIALVDDALLGMNTYEFTGPG